MDLQIKRAYDAPSPQDGKRILVDRLWPRGLTKEKAKIDVWLKEIAPSAELREWFGHDPAKWSEFQARYKSELAANTTVVDQLRETIGVGPATLVFAAKDADHNQALVLKAYLEE
jgi:uncharacterized protein YeaO (DUF488 family)